MGADIKSTLDIAYKCVKTQIMIFWAWLKYGKTTSLITESEKFFQGLPSQNYYYAPITLHPKSWKAAKPIQNILK